MIWQRISTVALVTVVAGIVWLFAESESVRTRKVPLTVQLVADPASGYLIKTTDAEAWQERVEVTVTGSASSLAGFEAGAVKVIRVSPGEHGVPDQAGESLLDLRNVFRTMDLFTRRGVTISAVEPSSIRVFIDRLATRPDVSVAVEVAGAEVEGVPVALPGRVVIRAPESLLKRLPDNARVVVRPDPAALSKTVGGRKEVIPRVLVLPPPELVGFANVTIEPAVVDVELTVKSRLETASLPNVPVQVMLPGLVAGEWLVKTDQTYFTDVRATGPVDVIDQLKRGEIKVFAVLTLSSDELERELTSKEVTFTTQPPLPGLSFRVDNPVVRFKASRRESVRPGGPPGP